MLSAVTLLVEDLEDALRWLTEVVGFGTPEEVVGMDGKRQYQLPAPGAGHPGLRLTEALTTRERVVAGNQFAGHVGLFVEVADLTDLEQRLSHPSASRGSTQRHAATEELPDRLLFRDPWGNRWCATQTSKP